MSIFGEVQPAVKKETGHVAVYTAIGAVLMWVIFGILHGVMPEKVPFDYTVFLGGIGPYGPEGCGKCGRGRGAHENEGQLFPADAFADAVGGGSHCASMLSVCGGDFAAVVSKSWNKDPQHCF